MASSMVVRSVELINNFDADNPLYLQSNDNSSLAIINDVLNGSNDVYQPIMSTILGKDPLPNVNDAFYVVSREESHRGLHVGGFGTNKSQPDAFVVKTNNNTNNFNRRVNTNNNNNANRGPNPNLLCKNYGLIGHNVDRCYEFIGYPAGFKRNPNLSKQSRNNNNKRFNGNSKVNHYVPSTFSSLSSSFTNEQMMKLLSLINEKPSPTANMSGIKPNFFNNNSKYVMYNVTLGWIIDSGANQHTTDSTKEMFNIVDISSFILTVGHPNGTLAKITVIGSLRLTSGIVLFDVLVEPEYNDLNLGKIIGTGSETGSLYLFDLDKINKCVTAKSNYVFVCRVSSELWHYRLGHPVDQVLSILG
ncbi:hypothetical protein Tco_0519664 [Tanacetum coccineum]